MTPRTTKPLVAALFTLTLLLPTTAAAQQYDPMMLRTYWAAVEIYDRVWLNNPNQVAAIHHSMEIMYRHGIYPPNFPAPQDIRVYEDPQGTSNCIYIDGVPECNDWHTYRCRTPREIDELNSFRHGSNWFGWWFTSASGYAFYVGQGHVGVMFLALGQMFNAGGLWADWQIDQWEKNRCMNP